MSTYASLWDECDNIAECAEDFKNLCVEWFDLAIARSLSETISILKAYLFETNSDAANLLYEKHSGLATILGVVSKQSGSYPRIYSLKKRRNESTKPCYRHNTFTT